LREVTHRLEDDMMTSKSSILALSACLAIGFFGSIAAAQAPLAGVPNETQVIVVVAQPLMPGLIAPSNLYGAGPPTDGLDTHPYLDAEPSRKAVNAGGRSHQSARAPAKAGGPSTSKSGSSTSN
jgi:hypothetical protein